jgi:hypothetical protein
MTATRSNHVDVPIRSEATAPAPVETEGAGWLFLAGSVLGVAGLMRIVDSIWAFTYDGAVPEDFQDAVFGNDLTTYGWVWLGVGVLLLVSSFLVLKRSQFGRWVGFAAAAIGCVTAMVWMPYYPVWSLAYVGLAMLVIYALAAYGGPEFTRGGSR